MILKFGAQLGYKGRINTFIFLKNLVSALLDTKKINKKLTNDLVSYCMEPVTDPRLPFISSLLSLMAKHNGSWRTIHDLLYPVGRLINNNISNHIGKMRYTRF